MSVPRTIFAICHTEIDWGLATQRSSYLGRKGIIKGGYLQLKCILLSHLVSQLSPIILLMAPEQLWPSPSQFSLAGIVENHPM